MRLNYTVGDYVLFDGQGPFQVDMIEVQGDITWILVSDPVFKLRWVNAKFAVKTDQRPQ